MSAPRPQSSRGRGRGRHGGQGVNNSSLAKEATRDQSPNESNNVSPAGVNRQRKKKPEVQRYVPRGRRLLNQQDEEARIGQSSNRSSPPLSSNGSNPPVNSDYTTSNLTENIGDQSVRGRTKNEVDSSLGRNQEEQDNQKYVGDFSEEVSQNEVSGVSATETNESIEQKGSEEDFLGNREVNNCMFVEHCIDSSKGTQHESKDTSQVDVLSHSNCDISESRGEEECMDVKEENNDLDGTSDQNKRIECESNLNDEEILKEKVVEDINMAETESERTNELLEKKEEATVIMETNTQDDKVDDGEDDIPLNWDDDVEESNENSVSKNIDTTEAKSENQDGESIHRKVKTQESEGKTEVKKIKLKKSKKKSKTSGEAKVEDETPSVEKKGKKKSTRTNITVFDMMNMHELKEDKKEEKKAEIKEQPIVDVEENVLKGDKSDKEADEDEGDWDTMFDDDGECLDPSAMEELTKTVGKVQIEKATINYLDFKPKEPDYDEMNHVIEIFDFPAEFKTEDLLSIFSQFKSKGFDIKWVDDTHALGVFSSVIAAQDALKIVHPLCKVGPLSEASKACKAKAKRCVEFLQPYKPRPETTAMTARRLVTGALGLTPQISKEQRELERKKLKEAKEKRRSDRKQREDMWEGTIASGSS
ncbi:coiled-coil domain-containing protein R3HCC1L-like [Saccostrea cucullata]|uniref:coiled-coil domain-containing protein R3HCC1L-like n=1 Tax=Saccostrea cuccullata TaxID=36930 RepID=UPI002ED221FD